MNITDDSEFKRLFLEYGNSCFDCGEYDTLELGCEGYLEVAEKCNKARGALLTYIKYYNT
jgi:hypothetical protein